MIEYALIAFIAASYAIGILGSWGVPSVQRLRRLDKPGPKELI